MSHRSAAYGGHTPPYRSQVPPWLAAERRERRSFVRRRRFLVGYALFALACLALILAAGVAGAAEPPMAEVLADVCRGGTRLACVDAPESTGAPASAVATADALQPVEKLADNLAADGVFIGLASAADLGTTAYALRHCHGCYEANPLTPDVESRVAIKAAMYPVAMGACYWMRRKGWDRQATGLRWGIVAILTAVSINNVVQAHRGAQ